MTREEAISIMNVIVHMLEEKYDTDRVEEAVDMAIKALEQEPCEDCISRKRLKECFHRNVVGADAFDTIIDMQPSIQPIRHKGEWVNTHDPSFCKCSVCGAFWEKEIIYHCNIKFCPNCGARMESEDKE